jgi:hypothetical protein
MAGPCPDDFERLAAQAGGFGCDGAKAFVQFRNPFELTNWTLPVIECLLVTCAVLALVHAVRRYRLGDRIPLALWLGTLVYLAVIEPPTYFPNLVGQQDTLGVVFVHNVFTVEFLWNRLPLYIIALYPAVVVLAYEVVRSLGVFERRGPLAGAAAVMFVHHGFYEVFDHLGPQRGWWLWNPDSDPNHPSIASVPMTSIVLFATLAPGVLTWVAVAWSRRRDGQMLDTGRGLVACILLVGIAAPVAVVVGGMPAQLAGGGGDPNVTAQAVVLSTMLAGALAWGLWEIVATIRTAGSAVAMDRVMWASGLLFTGVFAVLWGSSLPAYFDARAGVTSAGTLTGSLPYAALCYLTCCYLLYRARPAPSGRAHTEIAAANSAI